MGGARGGGGAGAKSNQLSASRLDRAVAVARRKPAFPPFKAAFVNTTLGTVHEVSHSQTGAPVCAARATAVACGSTP